MPTSPNERREPAQPTPGITPQPHDDRVTVTPAQPVKLIRLPEVEARTGLKKSSVYAGMKARTFPPCLRIGARAVAWKSSDIDRWISERVTTGGQS